MTVVERRTREIVESYFGSGLDDSVYQALDTVPLHGGDWLFRQGDPGDSLYFVVRGRLQAWARAPGEPAGERLLGELLPGDSVGEAGLLTGEARTAGIRAIRDSVLIRLDKPAFEKLAEQHPAMVLRLASNVATMMQRNLSGTGARSRGFSTVTLVHMHDTPCVAKAADQLSSRLQQSGGARLCTQERLVGLGAPVGATACGDELPEALKQWLADQEGEHPMVVYECALRDTPWARFALRQADLVLMLADASASPAQSIEESALFAPGTAPSGHRALVLLHPEHAEIRRTGAWLADRRLDYHLHVRGQRRTDMERVVRVVEGRAVGLVLGAGAVRGLAELGVYQAISETGVPIDWVGGSSIGSIVGAAIAHDWEPEHAINVAREAFVRGKPFSDYTIPVISLIRGRRMMRLLKSLVNTDIEDLPIPYFCVSSNLGSGQLIIHERGSLVKAVRASAALPGVLPPAVVESELVVDGAVLNNLPVDIMRRRPVGRIIAVDVSSQVKRTVDYEETPSSWAILRGRWLPFSRRHRVPGLATVILRATEIGTLGLAQERGEMADLLIRPPVRKFGMTDVRAFDQIVEAGYREGRKALEAWGE